jgi:hypothetical protein
MQYYCICWSFLCYTCNGFFLLLLGSHVFKYIFFSQHLLYTQFLKSSLKGFKSFHKRRGKILYIHNLDCD